VTILRTVLLSVALLSGGGAALAVATDGFQAFTTETGRRVAVRRHPVALPRVSLENQSGVSMTLADSRGKWLLVDFMYTRCVTFCTALGADFARLEAQLSGPVAQGRVALLSISFDPLHDSPTQLTAYLERSRAHGTGWQAARPINVEELPQLMAAFGITVIRDQFGGYTHNAAIHLVDPEGRLVDIFALGNPDLVGRALLDKLAS
jgi:protein SCO1/2